MNAAVRRCWFRVWPALGCAGFVAIWMLVPGCDTPGGSSGGGAAAPPAEPVQHPLLQNIPLPVNFRMVPERSVARAAGAMRVAQCEFDGPTAPEAVVRFYEEYLPTAKFVLCQKRFDNGEYSLRFESSNEECNIRVKGKGTQTVLIIDIGPLSKGALEQEASSSARRP